MPEEELPKLIKEVKLLQDEINQLANQHRQCIQAFNEIWNILFFNQGSETVKIHDIQLLMRSLLLSQNGKLQDTPRQPNSI